MGGISSEFGARGKLASQGEPPFPSSRYPLVTKLRLGHAPAPRSSSFVQRQVGGSRCRSESSTGEAELRRSGHDQAGAWSREKRLERCPAALLGVQSNFPAFLRSPQKPKGDSPGSVRSPQKPKGVSPGSVRSPQKPTGVSPGSVRSPQKPKGVSPGSARSPQKPTGVSPASVGSRRWAEEGQSDLRARMAPTGQNHPAQGCRAREATLGRHLKWAQPQRG